LLKITPESGANGALKNQPGVRQCSKKKTTLRNLCQLATLAALPLFAGCGGGDDSSASNNSSTPGGNPVACFIVFLATGEAVCSNSSDSPSPELQAQSSSGLTSDSAVRANAEIELGADLANANLPTYAIRNSPEQKIGWYGVGSVNDVTDITDAYAFTPTETRDYYLALCPPEGSSCDNESGIDTLTAFFRVLDQDGNVLLTSEADTVNGNGLSTTFDAGVMYYVTVDAGDTMGAKIDYRLFVVESS